jgi:rod shape-determining protein MreC
MDIKSPRYIRAAVITLAIVGILALALGGYMTPVYRVTSSPIVKISTWFSSRYMALYEFLTVPRDIASLRQSNANLEAENSRLQAQVIELQQQLSEAQLADLLLKYARTRPENRYIAASVIGRDPSPFLHYVIIEHGSDDGLMHGMPVVTDQGLVGRIDAVSPSASRVQLITDPGSAVNVSLQTSQKEAILDGSITGDLTVSMIPQDLDVSNGDVVLTSGLGGAYPNNLLIGQVTGVRKLANDLFQSASVQPAVDFSSLNMVLVITNFKPVDITPLVPTAAP